MKLNSLLWLQIAYCLAGVVYNVVSGISVSLGGPQYSTTDPVRGGIAMSLYGLLLVPGFLGRLGLYRVLMALAVAAFAYGGIYRHLGPLATGDFSAYQSLTAWALAIGINIYGLVLNVLAVAGWFRRED